MSILSKIDPNITFRDLETLICNTSDMADALNAVVWDHFAKKAPDAGYVLTPEEGSRIFFLAGMALEMSRKAYDAYPPSRYRRPLEKHVASTIEWRVFG